MKPWVKTRAVNVLSSGGIIAYPTEAIYGLGCDPFDRFAVGRLLELKNRPMEKGLILVAAHWPLSMMFLTYLIFPGQS